MLRRKDSSMSNRRSRRRPFTAFGSRTAAQQPAEEVTPLSTDSPLTRTVQVRADEQKLAADLLKAKDAYKEGISIAKDTLDVAWKLAPLAFLPASLFLWVYLRSIRWTTIFQDSAMTGSGLIFLFVAAMLMVFGIVLQFASPSLLMIGTVSYYGNDRTVPKAVPRLYRWAMGGWFVGLTLIIALDTSRTWIVGIAPFAVAAVYALTHQKALELDVRPGAWRYTRAFHALFLAGAATLTMFGTSMPLLLTLDAAQRYAAGGISETVIGVLVCVGTSVVSLLPGYMYLNARTWSVGIYRPFKLAMLGGFFLSYIVLAGAAFSIPVASTVLRIAGVYSNEKQTYEVSQPNVVNVLSAAGMPVVRDKGVTSVTAYLRYGFGGTRLLCRSEFSPAALTDEAIKAALEKKQPDPRGVAGSGCVSVSTTEVRLFRP